MKAMRAIGVVALAAATVAVGVAILADDFTAYAERSIDDARTAEAIEIVDRHLDERASGAAGGAEAVRSSDHRLLREVGMIMAAARNHGRRIDIPAVNEAVLADVETDVDRDVLDDLLVRYQDDAWRAVSDKYPDLSSSDQFRNDQYRMATAVYLLGRPGDAALVLDLDEHLFGTDSAFGEEERDRVETEILSRLFAARDGYSTVRWGEISALPFSVVDEEGTAELSELLSGELPRSRDAFVNGSSDESVFRYKGNYFSSGLNVKAHDIGEYAKRAHVERTQISFAAVYESVLMTYGDAGATDPTIDPAAAGLFEQFVESAASEPVYEFEGDSIKTFLGGDGIRRQLIVGAFLMEATFHPDSTDTLVEFFDDDPTYRRFLDLRGEHPEIADRIVRRLDDIVSGYRTAADGR